MYSETGGGQQMEMEEVLSGKAKVALHESDFQKVMAAVRTKKGEEKERFIKSKIAELTREMEGKEKELTAQIKLEIRRLKEQLPYIMSTEEKKRLLKYNRKVTPRKDTED
jgi:hypothetical protein